MPPGARCSRLASCWSTMACPGAFVLYSWPARTLTRSTLTPSGPVGTRTDVHVGLVTRRQHGGVERGGGHRRDMRQPGERRVVPVEPGALGRDLELRRVGPLQQPRVGGVGAPRAGGGGEHDAADEPEQHGEAEQRRPAPPDVRAQREPDRGHSQHSIAAPARRQYGRHPGESSAAITPRSTVAGRSRAASQPGAGGDDVREQQRDRDGEQHGGERHGGRRGDAGGAREDGPGPAAGDDAERQADRAARRRRRRWPPRRPWRAPAAW